MAGAQLCFDFFSEIFPRPALSAAQRWVLGIATEALKGVRDKLSAYFSRAQAPEQIDLKPKPVPASPLQPLAGRPMGGAEFLRTLKAIAPKKRTAGGGLNRG